MTVSTTSPRVSYSGDSTTGNDGTGSFAYSKYFINDADLKVVKTVTSTGVETTLTLTTDYTISGTKTNGVYPSGATVVINSGEGKYPLTTETITIINDPSPTQTIDYTANDAFPAETHERGLDKLTTLVQRLDDRADRALSKPDTTANWDANNNKIINVSDPTAAQDAATKTYVDTEIASATLGGGASDYLLKAGGTMTGDLVLAGDPDANLKAATKQYVDAAETAASEAYAHNQLYISGRWINGFSNDVSSGATTLNADVVYAYPVFIGRSVTFSNYAIEPTNTNSWNSVVGIYNSAATGLPGTLNTTLGVLAATGTANTIVSGANSVTLTPGIYWFAINSSAAATIRAFGSASSNDFYFFGYDGSATSFNGSAEDYCVEGAHTYDGTLPSSFPSLSYSISSREHGFLFLKVT